MLIRTQDKEKLIDLTNVMLKIEMSHGYIHTDYYIVAQGIFNIELGKYSSREKVMKVMDMIECAARSKYSGFHMPKDSEVIV